MAETLDKNAIDKSEYPQTAELENRCVNILADLWNVPRKYEYLGTSTVGSSEACMLAGMAMKFRWRNQAREMGIDVDTLKPRPNLVISAAYQVCWEKFCVYWDVELRAVPVRKDQLTLDLDRLEDYVDDHTIGIVGIQGTTYSGEYDDLKGLNAFVEKYNRDHPMRPQLVIHVDAACGGMLTPFTEPELHWDFRLANVVSISTSGHKYGLTYPGVGWIIWKDRKYTADRLVIATGGKSYASTGSTGDGYRFAKQFGHRVVELKSALCPIRVKERINREMLKLTLKNVSLSAKNDRFHKTIFGDMEFLPGSVTGPIVLSMSSLINREDPVELSLDFKPALDDEKLDKRLLRETENNPNKNISYLLTTLLPKEICAFFIENTGIDSDLALNSLTREKRKELLDHLKHFRLSFDRLEDIDKGIVTSGGVDVNEIDPRTMESKICDGLYFIGEVLDVDALTGGFNLQIALSTGYSCATALKG